MIDVNEIYLIEALVSIGASEAEVKKVLKRLRGCRIYVRDKEIEKKEIIEFMCKKINQGIRKSEVIYLASRVFEKSERWIREIIKGECEKKD